MIKPDAPAAQTSFEATPQTPLRPKALGVAAPVQEVPFQWVAFPESPTAQMSLGPKPQSARSVPELLGTDVQVAPVQCSITPALPHAQTSFGALAQTA